MEVCDEVLAMQAKTQALQSSLELCVKEMCNYCRNIAAIAIPLRNCDVGTAEEQDRRFERFCNNQFTRNGVQSNPCLTCPLPMVNCKLSWAQMPYEEGGEK